MHAPFRAADDTFVLGRPHTLEIVRGAFRSGRNRRENLPSTWLTVQAEAVHLRSLGCTQILGMAIVLGVMTFAAQANAQRTVPTTVENSTGSPVPVEVVGTAQFLFVGFSAMTVPGGGAGAGLLSMNASCAATFAGSRTCTTLEVFKTTSLPAGVSGTGWIQPTIVGGVVNCSAGDAVTGQCVTNCDGWSNSGSFAGSTLVLNDSAPIGGGIGTPVPYSGFYRHTCSDALPVACCAPAP